MFTHSEKSLRKKIFVGEMGGYIFPFTLPPGLCSM